MIRSESEYKEAVARLEQEHNRLDEQKRTLDKTGLDREQIRRVLEPMLSAHLELREQVDNYDRFRRGEFEELINLRDLGQLLIGSRIARGLSQRELAERLQVHESQVSRDERNEYFNITLERATKILEALDVVLRSTVEAAPRDATQAG